MTGSDALPAASPKRDERRSTARQITSHHRPQVRRHLETTVNAELPLFLPSSKAAPRRAARTVAPRLPMRPRGRRSSKAKA